MLKRFLFLIPLNLLMITPAFALLKKADEVIISPEKTIMVAQSDGFGITGKETWLKKDINKLKKKNNKEFNEQVFNDLDNSLDYVGLLREVYVDQKNVEKAKILAKYYIFAAIRKNWVTLKQSVVNDISADTFDSFKPHLKRIISEIQFNPHRLKGNKFDLSNYRFTLPEWGEVNVDKNLKKLNWKIDMASKHDSNRLQDGVKDIKTDKDLAVDEDEEGSFSN